MTQPLMKPTEVELLNPNASFRQSKDGNRYWVKFEITRDLWELFEAPNPGLRLRGLVWIADDDESDRQVMQDAIDKPAKKEKKAGKPKGEYGKFYQQLFKQWFFRNKDLRKVLDCEGLPIEDDESVKGLLAEKFSVTSLSFVSPERLETWLEENGLTSLVTISRNAHGRFPSKEVSE